MSAKRISRRTFLKVAGIALGAAGLGYLGVPAIPGPKTAVATPTRDYGKEHNMEKPILVTYATCTGATVGVAEAIGRTLAESGAPVEVRCMQDVTDLTPYRAVVAGSAIQGKEWLPEAMQFVRRHQGALARKPFAAFMVCMTLAMPNGEKYRPMVAEWMQPVRSLVRPVSEGQFAGVLDISKIPSFGDRLKFRFSVAVGVWKEGDHRDWNAIRTWAASLKPLLQASA